MPLAIMRSFICLGVLNVATVTEPAIAPTPPIAPSQPRPLGPTLRTSPAKTGRMAWYGMAKTVMATPISINPTSTLLCLT